MNRLRVARERCFRVFQHRCVASLPGPIPAAPRARRCRCRLPFHRFRPELTVCMRSQGGCGCAGVSRGRRVNQSARDGHGEGLARPSQLQHGALRQLKVASPPQRTDLVCCPPRCSTRLSCAFTTTRAPCSDPSSQTLSPRTACACTSSTSDSSGSTTSARTPGSRCTTALYVRDVPSSPAASKH